MVNPGFRELRCACTSMSCRSALRRVAMLWNAAYPGMTLRYRAAEAVAKTMGIIVQPLPVREPKEFDRAFAAMKNHMPDAILMVHDALTSLNRKRVFEFVAAHRLPAIYEDDLYVRDGGLMSFGPDSNESLARVAALVDRILKGAKPAAALSVCPQPQDRQVARSHCAGNVAGQCRRGDRITTYFTAVQNERTW